MGQGNETILFLFISALLFVITFMSWLWQTHLRKKTLTRILDANALTTRKNIEIVLKIAQEQRSTFVIKKEAKGEPFNSFLLKNDLSQRSPILLIDSLFPKEGNDLIADARYISVVFYLKKTAGGDPNIPYMFNTHHLGKGTYQGYPAWKISFPEAIERNQRRNYKRIEPAEEKSIDITLTLDNQIVMESIANISGGGIGFYTHFDESVFWIGKIIDKSSFRLPDGTEISSPIIVRWLTKDIDKEISKKANLYCGAQFMNSDNVKRNKIIKYVAGREREELRKLGEVS